MSINFLIAIIVILFLFYVGMQYFLKQRTRKNTLRLTQLVLQQEYEKFDKLVQDPEIQKTVSPYQTNLLKFNSYIARNDKKRADQAFSAMNELNLLSQQKLDFYGSAQNYYIEQRDLKRAKICHEKLDTVRKHENEKEYFNVIYQVMVNNDTSYQKMIEGRLNHEPDHKQLSDMYLLIHIFQVKQDHDKAAECEKLADQLLEKLQTKQN